jgi:hypothetical protein
MVDEAERPLLRPLLSSPIQKAKRSLISQMELPLGRNKIMISDKGKNELII